MISWSNGKRNLILGLLYKTGSATVILMKL